MATRGSSRVRGAIVVMALALASGVLAQGLPRLTADSVLAGAGAKAAQVVAHTALAAARVLRPEWTPGEAFLSKGTRVNRAAQHEDRWLEEKKKQLEEGNDSAP